MISKKWLLLVVFGIFISFWCTAKGKINVLILSGSNNHKWQETTPAIKGILEETGLFEVSITEEPEKMNSNMLGNYEVLLSNWNLFPEKNGNWAEETQNAVLDFVENGGGFVFVHAGSSANYDWAEFQKLAGATWGKGTRHGKQHSFEVVVEEFNHPIVNGMSNFWTTDELWIKMQNFKTCRIIGEAFAPKTNKGFDKMEPVMFEGKLGKGRTFFLVLGHDVKSMRNLGFKTLLQRGSEWAATGKVKQKLPHELTLKRKTSENKLKWKKDKNSLSLLNQKQTVWRYNFNPSEGKPYIHPLSTIQGTELTWLRPNDHPWHRAVWFSWKFINGVNFWEENRKTGVSDGKTEIISTNVETGKDFKASVTQQLGYRIADQEYLLTEERELQFSPPNKYGNYYVDWKCTFTAKEDVVLDRTPLKHEPKGKGYGGYAGFSIRLNKDLWDTSFESDQGEKESVHGARASYFTFNAKGVQGEHVGVSIFDDPDNYGDATHWYVWNTDNHPLYYFSPAVIFNAKMELKKGEKLKLKYRLLVHGEETDKNDIKAEWERFVGQ
ncbi:DUF6807 family protein [Saccharicrinis sp. GN24d3]|uniref:DUF6807 family protein n=1 Tax=Saccharicrinis sp. GN24d3 TaxID=3458416 RepID=UPI004035FDF0